MPSPGSIQGLAIKGISCCVPQQFMDNELLEIEAGKRQSIIRSTGVRYRRIATALQTGISLGRCAAHDLLKGVAIDPEEIGVCLFITQTPDCRIPGNAHRFQNILGLDSNTVCFDVNLGCSGYVYGLYLSGLLLNNSSKKYALLLAGDISSRYVSPRDMATLPLFGDAVSATLIEKTDTGEGQWTFDLGSRGMGSDDIRVRGGGAAFPFKEGSMDFEKDGDNYRREIDLFLMGSAVFGFILQYAPLTVQRVLALSGKRVEDIDLYVFHQANLLALESVRKKMGIAASKVLYSLQDYGNTSSASIPLTLVSHAEQISKEDRSKVLFSGFGVGLSWGSVVLELTNDCYLGLVED